MASSPWRTPAGAALSPGSLTPRSRRCRERGAGRVHAVLSACIHPECYAFSPEDVDRVAACFGDEVRARAAGGQAALDLPAAVRSALRRAGVELAVDLDACTACEGGWFSHRARNDRARHALVIWRDFRDG